MSRIYQTLGTVAMEPKGEYDATAYYEKLNVVNYNDSTYMAKEPVHGETPSTSSKWQLIGGGIKKEDTVFIFNTVAEMKVSGIENGMTVQTLGYYSANDGGGSIYKIRMLNENETSDEMSLISIEDNLVAELIVEKGEINLKQFGCYGDGIHDDTENFQALINYCFEKRIYTIILEGTYLISNTLYFESKDELPHGNSLTLQGRNQAQIKFSDETPNDTYMIVINKYASSCKFYNIYFNGVDKNKNGIKILGSADSLYGTQTWKNYFQNCVIHYFNQAIYIGNDADNPNDTTKMNYASENMFLHCKVKHCTNFVHLHNLQSFNNVFMQTDFENNQDESNNNPIIYVTSGGGLYFYSCSIIGAGSLVKVDFPSDTAEHPITNPDSLFGGNHIAFYSCRMEIFNNYDLTKALFNYVVNNSYKNRNATHSLKCYDLEFYDHFSGTNDIPLISSNSHIQAEIKGITAAGANKGKFIINLSQDSQDVSLASYISIEDCKRYIEMPKIPNSYTVLPRVTLKNIGRSKEVDGFREINADKNTSFVSYIPYATHNNSINIANFQAGGAINNRIYKFTLPADLFLTKFRFFLNSSNRNSAANLTLNLHIVKDKSLWVDPDNLDLSTDSIIIGTLTMTGTQFGIHETDINYSNLTVSSSDIRTAKLPNFSEGKYAISLSSSNGSNFNGMISIEYMG